MDAHMRKSRLRRSYRTTWVIIVGWGSQYASHLPYNNSDRDVDLPIDRDRGSLRHNHYVIDAGKSTLRRGEGVLSGVRSAHPRQLARCVQAPGRMTEAKDFPGTPTLQTPLAIVSEDPRATNCLAFNNACSC